MKWRLQMKPPHKKISDGLDIDRISHSFRPRNICRMIWTCSASTEAVLGQGTALLDCPGGASSFALEAARKGYDVTACDILYDRGATVLFEKGKKDFAHVFEKFDGVSHLYAWDYYRSKQQVMTLRNKALELFVEDFSGYSAEGRYIPAGLPLLPFPDGMFSLVLSAHLLFLYGDRLDLDFHKACLDGTCKGMFRGSPHIPAWSGSTQSPILTWMKYCAFSQSKESGRIS